MTNGRLTEWSIISSGEGGNKIATLFLATRRHEAIGNRVVLLNTARADLMKAEQMFENLKSAFSGRIDESAIRSIEKLEEHFQVFAEIGAGNLWMVGEEALKKDFEGSELVRRKLDAMGVPASDAHCDIFTLGGGTGCGSMPYLIYKTKSENITRGKHIAVAVWPESNEGDQRHFNAICGFSRLISYNGQQNADLIILISNDKLAEMSGVKGRQDLDAYFRMNERIADVLELMIAPGRTNADVTIDIPDYVTLPKALKITHVVPCISRENDVDIIEVETALEDAKRNPLFPCKPETALMVWAIFRVPKDRMNEFEHGCLRKTFDEWVKENTMCKVVYMAITYDESVKDEYDVLLLLGGCDIDIDDSYRKYKSFRRMFEIGGDMIEIEVGGEIIRKPITILDEIESTLNTYFNRLTDARGEGGGMT